MSSQEAPGISSVWHWELPHTFYEVLVVEAGQAFWHVLVKPHFPDPSGHASRQKLHKAILAMLADGRMPEPVQQIRVTIPQPGADIPIPPLDDTVRDGVGLPYTPGLAQSK